MPIFKEQLNGNPDTMVTFINKYTYLNGINATISDISADVRYLQIYDARSAQSIICGCNHVHSGNYQRMDGQFVMYGGGIPVTYGGPYLPNIGYATSKGLLFPIAISDSTNQCSCFLVSKTNNDCYGAACQYFSLSASSYNQGNSQAIGDKPLESGQGSPSYTMAFPEHPGAGEWAGDNWLRDQIQLVPIPTRGNGVISYFPHAFWIPCSPTREYGIVQVGDKKYAMSSYMALEE